MSELTGQIKKLFELGPNPNFDKSVVRFVIKHLEKNGPYIGKAAVKRRKTILKLKRFLEKSN